MGASIIASGFAAAALWAVMGLTSVSSKIDDFQRVPLGGSAEVTFPEAGAYVIYYERPPGAKGGSMFHVGSDVGPEEAFHVNVEIEPLDGGVGGGLDDYRSTLTYNLHGRSGTAVGTFQILEPGRFMFHTTESSEDSGLVALGPSLGRRLAATIFGGLFLTIGGVVLGGVTMLAIGAKRRNARRRAEMGAQVFR